MSIDLWRNVCVVCRRSCGRKYLHCFPLFRMVKLGVCVIQVLKSPTLYLLLSNVADFCELWGSVFQCIQDWNGAEWTKYYEAEGEARARHLRHPGLHWQPVRSPGLFLISLRAFLSMTHSLYSYMYKRFYVSDSTYLFFLVLLVLSALLGTLFAACFQHSSVLTSQSIFRLY